MLPATEAERMTQAQIPVSQLTAWLESRLYSAQSARQSYAEMLTNYVTQANTDGMTAHWARVIDQTATSLRDASVTEEVLTNLLREIVK